MLKHVFENMQRQIQEVQRGASKQQRIKTRASLNAYWSCSVCTAEVLVPRLSRYGLCITEIMSKKGVDNSYNFYKSWQQGVQWNQRPHLSWIISHCPFSMTFNQVCCPNCHYSWTWIQTQDKPASMDLHGPSCSKRTVPPQELLVWRLPPRHNWPAFCPLWGGLAEVDSQSISSSTSRHFFINCPGRWFCRRIITLFGAGPHLLPGDITKCNWTSLGVLNHRLKFMQVLGHLQQSSNTS